MKAVKVGIVTKPVARIKPRTQPLAAKCAITKPTSQSYLHRMQFTWSEWVGHNIKTLTK